MKKIWIFIAISGAIAVIMGAMSAHMLKDVLTVKEVSFFIINTYEKNLDFYRPKWYYGGCNRRYVSAHVKRRVRG